MLTRWNDLGFADLEHTFAALAGLHDDMGRVFQRFDHAPNPLDAGQPALQIRDDGEALVLSLAVPGLAPEDLQITLEQESLILRGARKEQAPAGYTVHRKERAALKFARAIELPARIQADQVEANLQNGVLSLRLPKAAAEKPRTISVKAA
jgi:HSP20 family protein